MRVPSRVELEGENMSETKYCPLQNAHCSERCAWYDEICGYCEVSRIAVSLNEIATILNYADEAMRTVNKQEGAAHE